MQALLRYPKHQRRAVAQLRDAGTTRWLLRRSLHGRVNQVDLLIDGTIWRTGSLRDALAAIRWQKWRVHKTPAQSKAA